MENNAFRGRRYVLTWDDDYIRLKHLRWVRNQLSHEVGYDSDICEEDDYFWLKEFRDRLFSSTDPLAEMHKSIKAEKQRAEEQRHQMQRTQNRESDISLDPIEDEPLTTIENEPNKSGGIGCLAGILVIIGIILLIIVLSSI